MSEKGSAQPDAKHVETKSYWYPDQTPYLGEVKKGYSVWNTDGRLFPLLLIPVVSFILGFITLLHNEEIFHFLHSLKAEFQTLSSTPESLFIIICFIAGLLFLLFVITIYFMTKARKVYLIDFKTYQPPDELKVSHEKFMDQSVKSGFFDKEALDFQEKLLYRTGIGNDTYFPEGPLFLPPRLTMEYARKEAEDVLGGCLDALFASTGVSPQEVDILIVNCSLFNPTPSLAAMMVNKYKMRTDIKSFNLSGMGCSAGLISIELAKDLLQVYRNSIAVVLSTENITQNWYTGNQKSMLISNTLFRVGGAAIMLSNKWIDSFKAKYKLECTVRVCKAANDQAYNAVFQKEDPDGKRGVALSKDLLQVAGDALKTNITILGPLVLPWSEQIKFFLNLSVRKLEQLFKVDKSKRTPPYIPNFKKAIQHFCIHAGGRAIIDGLEENLKLDEIDVEPSRATLYRYGNTSSSSIWYELQYIERSGRMKKGDKVWQIALGSGFKVNSAVWKRIQA